MNYQNAGDLQPGGRVGPLTPYQRPLVILLFLAIPLAGSLLLGWFLLGGDWIYKRFKYDKHSTAEVSFDTIETATTANDLLSQLIKDMRDFDTRSKEIFGPDHEWLDGDQRAETPEAVYRYVQEQNNKKFLERYFKLSNQRLEMEQQLSQLEKKVDASVSSLTEDATAESRFKAERLITKDISKALDNVKVRRDTLERLAKEFLNRGNNDN